MRRFLPLLLPAALVGCARTIDQFKPQIVVTSPQGGAVSANKRIVLRGYVLDDRGVASLKVQGKAISIKKGQRIEPFEYQSSLSGKVTQLSLEATDGAGNVSTLTLPITVDTQPPRITVTKVEREGKTVRVSGVVTDNTGVAQISVDGVALTIVPGTSSEFYAETSGVYADIQATDGAGNVAKLRAQ